MNPPHRNVLGANCSSIAMGITRNEEEAVRVAGQHKRLRRLKRREKFEAGRDEAAKAKITLPVLRFMAK